MAWQLEEAIDRTMAGMAKPGASYYIPPGPPAPPLGFLRSFAVAGGWDRCRERSPATTRVPSPPPFADTRARPTSSMGARGPAMVVSPMRPVMSNGFGKIEGGDLSSLSPPPVPYVFNGGLTGRKVAAMEKVVKRR